MRRCHSHCCSLSLRTTRFYLGESFERALALAASIFLDHLTIPYFVPSDDALGSDFVGKRRDCAKNYKRQNSVYTARGISQEDLRDQDRIQHRPAQRKKSCTGAVVHEKTKREPRRPKNPPHFDRQMDGVPGSCSCLVGVDSFRSDDSFRCPFSNRNSFLKVCFGCKTRPMDGFIAIGVPAWLRSMLVEGVYRVLAWVVSVMLPPMAIFSLCSLYWRHLGATLPVWHLIWISTSKRRMPAENRH